MTVHTQTFREDQLELVHSNVVLASGGGLMDIESVKVEEDGTVQVTTTWLDQNGQQQRFTIDARCLRTLAPLDLSAWFD